jgi:MFS family permease
VIQPVGTSAGAGLRGTFSLLAFGLALTFFSSFGQTFLVSLFVPAFTGAFGLTQGGFGALYSVATLLSAAMLPWAGARIDRMRLTRFSLAVVLLMAVSAGVLAVAWSVWVLFVGIVGIRLAGQGLSAHAAANTMARYYGAVRGKALAVSGLGFALGEALLPLAASAALLTVGWRGSWGVVGLLALGVFAPSVVLLLRRSGVELDPRRLEDPGTPAAAAHGTSTAPAPGATRAAVCGSRAPATTPPAPAGGASTPEGEVPAPALVPAARAGGLARTPAGGAPPGEPRHWTRGEVLRDPRFAGILPVFLLSPFWITGLFLYQLAVGESRGWGVGVLASAFLAYAAARVVTAILSGGLVDRYSAIRLFPLTVVPMGAGIALLLVSPAVPVAFLYMTLLGVSVGMSATVKPALWAELYGTRHLGGIKSMLGTMMVVGTAGSPILVGALLDRGIPLDTLFTVAALTCFGGAVLGAWVLRGTPAPRAPDAPEP